MVERVDIKNGGLGMNSQQNDALRFEAGRFLELSSSVKQTPNDANICELFHFFTERNHL
jgi:hypothetical protein